MLRAWVKKQLHLKKDIDPEIRNTDLIAYCVSVGFFPLLNGFRYRCFFKKTGRLLYVGLGTRIFFPHFIETGERVMIGHHSYVSGLSKDGIRIQDDVHIREYAWIQATSRFDDPGKGVVIGKNTYIGPHAYIGAGGGIEIGQNVVIGACVHLLAENHEFQRVDLPIRDQGVSRRGIVIGDDVWIGNQVVILDGLRIGKGSVVGAGSVVTHDVPENTVVAGNPAREIRKRGSV